MLMEPNVRILIVDDMPAVRGILRNMLEELGLTQVCEAEGGEDAWDMIRSRLASADERIGLVIADWNMPGMSGVELLRTIRSHAPTRVLPFIMITSQGDTDHLSEAQRAGVTDYIVKPFNGPQLGEKLVKLISLRH